MFWKIFLFLFFTINSFGNNFHDYWEDVSYDKWNTVPKKEISSDTNVSMTKEKLSFYIQLYKEADCIGVLQAKRYKKVNCNSESGLCGVYKADVVHMFKGDKKTKSLTFEDDYTNNPKVYANKAIYILYKHGNMYYQDEFIQLDSVKVWLEFFNRLSKNKVEINNSIFKSLHSFCKSTGIKESEIRALNPWINNKATNIPLNAEIIIPKLNREGKQ